MDVTRRQGDVEEAEALLGERGVERQDTPHPELAGDLDPDDTFPLHEGAEEEDPDEEDVKATVYADEKEAELVAEEGAAARSSPNEYIKQAALCGALIFISVYEAVFKQRAVRTAVFDFNSLLVMQAIVSVVLGLGMTLYNGQSKELTQGFFFKFIKFAPVGAGFAAAAYIQMIALVYLSVDVFKVLEQSRLLVTAFLGWLLLRRKLSTSSWVALLSITLCCLTYGQLKTQDKAFNLNKDVMQKAVVRTQQVRSELSAATTGLEATMRDSADMSASALALTSFEAIADSVKGIGDDLAKPLSMSESSNVLTGLLLTGIFILTTAACGVYSELVLKKDHHVPFYVQKVFLELPGGIFSVLCTWLIRPLLVSHGIGGEKLKQSFLETGLFQGWDSATVVTTFVFLLAKSWLSGILVKQLSAVAKQVCSIVSVATLYFVLFLHDCGNKSAFLEFCPSGLQRAHFNIIVCDLCVLCTVVSYTTALRDKKRKQMFKKMFQEAEKKFSNAPIQS